MPAVDPFSASSRPMIPFDAAPSNPLPFASTLKSLDPNLPNLPAAYSLGLGKAPVKQARRYHEPLPTDYPQPIYTRHSRASSVVSEAGVGLEVGSDEWMDRQLQRCIDTGKMELDLTKKGLKTVSTRIADLQHLVTFSNSRSTNITSSSRPYTPSSPSPTPSNLPSHINLSTGRDNFSADARPFQRAVSAPVTFTSTGHPASARRPFFGAQRPRVGFNRVPSTLAGNSGLLASPTLTERSEDTERGDENRDMQGEGIASQPAIPVTTSPTGEKPLQRGFGRSQTTKAVLGASPQIEGNKGAMIYLGYNALTSLPTALFEVTNLTMLSIIHNKLTVLPAAIGCLHSLKELNIGGNQIEFLPYTIVHLNLDNLTLHPNRFLPAPDEPEAIAPTGGKLGPLIRHSTSTVSSLSVMVTNILISPREPSGLPPLLEHYSYQADAGSSHPLLDASVMRQHIPAVSEGDITRILQAARSISTDLEAQVKKGLRSSPASRGENKPDLFPNLNRPSKPDDAATNPYFSPCPSRHHEEQDSNAPYGRIRKHLYLHAAEERIEWRNVHGWPDIPVKWTGCSPGCLDFLEQEQVAQDGFELGDDWSLDEDDEEDHL